MESSKKKAPKIGQYNPYLKYLTVLIHQKHMIVD